MKINVTGKKSRYKEPRQLTQGLHFQNWLKNMVPNYNPDLISVHNKSKWSGHNVTIIDDGKLIDLQFSEYTESLRPLIPLFVHYFNGNGWSKEGFSEIYGSKTHPHLNGLIIRSPRKEDHWDRNCYGINDEAMDAVRDICADCGFKQSGPDGAITVTRFLEIANGQQTGS